MSVSERTRLVKKLETSQTRVPKRGLPVSISASKRPKSLNVPGPCIVGETGAYSILKISIRKKPSPTPDWVPPELADLGIESRACEWMSKDLFTSFFDIGSRATQVVAVVSVEQGSLAALAGVVYKDVIAYPSNGAWKLLGLEQVKRLYLEKYHKKGGMVLFVARKLSHSEKADFPYAYESNISEKLLDPHVGTTKQTSKPKTTSPAKKDTLHKTVTPSKLSDDDEDLVQALMAIPSIGKNLPAPPPKATKSITREELRSEDVVLSVGGYDRGLYSRVIRDWWVRYEFAGHAQKRYVVCQVVEEMHARGVRFLLKSEAKNNIYMIEPKGSLRISNKVLRALRQEVIAQTQHLPPEELKARERKIQLVRQAARRRAPNVVPMTNLAKKANVSQTVSTVSPQHGQQS